ncbi:MULTISPECIES: formate hydrogenlyase [unclassified Thiomonas]|uniref:formate hydrogenlyase n=1 Tax=unclassified Thiomonas TaxID=2625466 RepID=UPI0004DBC4EC|nr:MULTISPECIES: formate hydrogenlyase [unclassified Thiomonas]MDD5000952.1 formate hydrogenlyase [Thiomonas arsenitoxydans]MDE2173677.1 formate hydrogenlyase [Betaproteobacteria bacterium]CQR44329.1 Hydrogenase 4 membrane component (E)-like protein [Thiomonas sp. CB3]MDE2268025.1 formate hydrogenlyase [Betaproteobacteria bacterium]CDW92792.1 Hydrogenase 4 membrane component (E)-like protein [Thiomonas sp. CB2]
MTVLAPLVSASAAAAFSTASSAVSSAVSSASSAAALSVSGLPALPLSTQLIHLIAALLLLLSFAMLAQRRVVNLVNLFAAQGALLVASTVVVAYSTGDAELYQSAALTLLLKVIVLPLVLHKLIRRLHAEWDTETLVNIPTLQLIGIVLVIFSFVLAQPISRFAGEAMRGTLGIALALVLLAFLMMIVRRKAVAQVVGFLAMENGLLFAATSATQGMPMVVELGIGLDVLVGVFILGIFFFQIREQFDSLDLQNMESLKED